VSADVVAALLSSLSSSSPPAAITTVGAEETQYEAKRSAFRVSAISRRFLLLLLVSCDDADVEEF